MKRVFLGIFLITAFAASTSFAGMSACKEAAKAKDEVVLLAACEGLAKGGNGEAAFQIGEFYDQHLNKAKAMQWYQVAGKAGFAEAYNSIGLLFVKEAYGTPDYTMAAKWLRQGAEKGNIISANNLGAMYAVGGHGVKQDLVEAKKWLLMAYKTDPNAKDTLLKVTTDLCVKAFKQKDYATAEENCVYAVENGDKTIQFLLGTILSAPDNPRKDLDKALLWYKKAEAQGVMESQYQIAAIYFEKDQNSPLAVEWAKKAAIQGYPEAEFFLGRAYMKGYGVTKNTDTSLEWTLKAAQKGYPQAQFIIGVASIKNTKVIPHSYSNAYMWLTLAAQKGDIQAKEGLKQIAPLMTPEQIAEGKRLASEWKPSS